jgi:trimeric autotransporter adhesin
MSKIKRKLQLLAAFAALILLAFSIGCSGFFVDPTLSSITVTPATPSLVAGDTLQLTATGSYDDGSTKNISGSAAWTSSDNTIATVSSTGLLTGVAVGTATITASSAAISGPTTATIQVAGLQSITLTPAGNPSIKQGGTQQFTATGHLQDGSTPDITDSVTWTSTNTDVATIDASGLATALSVTTSSTTTIKATSGSVSATATLTVNP